MLHHDDLHPPDEVRLFRIPDESVRLWTAEARVYEVGVDDRVLRHDAFYRHWFAVNCTLDLAGRFATEAGPISWCFNCDVCTPLLSEDASAYTVDLFLDVLVGPDGREHVVEDRAEFEDAARRGWITSNERAGAERGLAELLRIR